MTKPVEVRRTVCIFLRALLLLGALAVVLTPAARADTIYTYTGQSLGNFSNGFACKVGFSCPITGSFTTLQPLGPNKGFGGGIPTLLAFSFTDGLTTWTNTNSSSGFSPFTALTDATGNITQWDISLFLPQSGGLFLYMETTNLPGFPLQLEVDVSGVTTFPQTCAVVCGNTPFAFNVNQPGTWSVSSTPPAPTPEPSGLLLLGSGLMSVMGLARRKPVNRLP